MRSCAILASVLTVLILAAPSSGMQKWNLPPWSDGRVETGCEFPDVPLTDIDGNTVWFNDFRGQPMMVVFCSCYTDTACSVIESLKKIRNMQPVDIFTVIVCCETAPALAEEGYRQLKEECRDAVDLVLIDDHGDTTRPFRLEVLPTTYLVDGDFCVRHRALYVSGLNAPAFRESLKAVHEELPGGN
jgi:hypothetical protein